ncbi:MAG TPA: 5'/3'-nucleotidase SurE [Anaerolineae bacterium]|nr:5'/3'-nucleotidase SurE [Anaerolineae bacterium]
MNSIKPLVLLTNDDGYASSGLRAVWRQLDSEYETCAVAPAKAKSWIGKALSNSNPLKIENEILDDKEIYVVNYTGNLERIDTHA